MKGNVEDGWDDLLGTGTVLKKIIEPGRRPQNDDEDISTEAPRKFFALIDIETYYDGKLIPQESHKNFLLNCDADLFAGAHLVIPLMDIYEKSRYIFDPKFAYSSKGLESAGIPPDAKLECVITLKIRSQYDDFLNELNLEERVQIGSRKKARGKFWFSREDYHNAITIYQSLKDLCQTPPEQQPPEDIAVEAS